MPFATGALLIRTSMQDLGVLGAGESARGEDMSDGLRRLQLMLSEWQLQPLTAYQTAREVFQTVAGQYAYFIGPGEQFHTARPPAQSSITGAGLLRLGSTPPVETPITVLTYAMYQAIQVKELQNPEFTAMLYRPGGLAGSAFGSQILLWPVPTEANPLVLYIDEYIPLFKDLVTEYPIPDGVQAAIQYNLTVALAPMYQVEPSPVVMRMAVQSLASMKRNNYQLTDVAVDPMFTMQTPGSGYDINAGNTQRRA